MFLHLGSDILVRLTDVVAILDLDTALQSRDTRELLDLARTEGRVKDPQSGPAKTIVLVDDMVYLSSISSTTLLRRVPATYIRPDSHLAEHG